MRGFKIQIPGCINILQSDPNAELYLCLSEDYTEVVTEIDDQGAGTLKSKTYLIDQLNELAGIFSDNHLKKIGLTNRELITQFNYPLQKAILTGGCSFSYENANPIKIPFPNFFQMVKMPNLTFQEPLHLGEFITGMYLQNWPLVKSSLQQVAIKIPHVNVDDFLGVINTEANSFALFSNTYAAAQFAQLQGLCIYNIDTEGIKII